MTIRVIATGGTFDKHYDEITGTLIFGACNVPRVIERSRITVPVCVEQLPPLDSLDMQDADRLRILACCEQAAEESIVIIHGTDTMRETADVLSRAKLAKTIVLTGAMIPYEVENSDALFNFGCAFGVVQTLAHGVYVAMNGQVFVADNVFKNREAGLFYQR